MANSRGEIAYVARKIKPPVRPLFSIFVKDGTKAKHVGRPIPKVKPQNISRVAVPYSPNEGSIMRNDEETTPNRTQTKRKRFLSNVLAITGPISMDSKAVR